MFKLISLIIWLVGLAAVSLGVLYVLGYKVNTDYLIANKERCQEQWRVCREQSFFVGTDSANCANDCMNKNIIIKRK